MTHSQSAAIVGIHGFLRAFDRLVVAHIDPGVVDQHIDFGDLAVKRVDAVRVVNVQCVIDDSLGIVLCRDAQIRSIARGGVQLN